MLLVDDQPGKLLSYEVMLEELDENLVPVSSAREALAYLLKSDVAVILVDVCMPELDGFELAQMIREHPRFQKTAIIFISAIHLAESDYLKGYEAGAVDYISVPVVPELLRAKVRVFAELFRKTRDLQKLNDDLERRVAERTRGAGRFPPTACATASRAGAWRWWPAIWAPGTMTWSPRHWFWDEGQSRIFGVDHAGFVPSLENISRGIHPEDVGKIRGAFVGLSAQKPDLRTGIPHRAARRRGALVHRGRRGVLRRFRASWCATAASPPTSPTARKRKTARRF